LAMIREIIGFIVLAALAYPAAVILATALS
jgi:hypothetical protein